MEFDLEALRSGAELDAAAHAFERDGYILLRGAGSTIDSLYLPIVAERLGVSEAEMAQILEPDSPAIILPEAIRQRMSRIDTPAPLAEALVEIFAPILRRFIGPFVKVSSNFHGQFKGGDATTTNYGGYAHDTKYLEVHRPYLIHQDFAASSIPTSPAGLTLWTPLNHCSDWTLRLWPGSHRHGMLCRAFPKLDDPKLSAFRPHVDVQARLGTAVIFNALLLHATSNPGQRRRLSTDLRFFPLAAFVPSRPRLLAADPLRVLHEGLERPDGPTLQAPLREALAFLGKGRVAASVPPLSILNWANYVAALRADGADAALPHLLRFVNVELGWDSAEAYLPALHNRPLHAATLAAANITEGAA